MSECEPMYVHKLVEYLTYFSGRFAIGIDAQGPTVADREHAMSVFRRGLGLSAEAGEGDQVRLTPPGLEPIEGVVGLRVSFVPGRALDRCLVSIHLRLRRNGDGRPPSLRR